MKAWLILLGGLLVWAAHFLAVYAIASALPGGGEAPFLVAAASLVAIAADALIIMACARMNPPDAAGAWTVRIGRWGAALSILAVILQTLPVLFV